MSAGGDGHAGTHAVGGMIGGHGGGILAGTDLGGEGGHHPGGHETMTHGGLESSTSGGENEVVAGSVNAGEMSDGASAAGSPSGGVSEQSGGATDDEPNFPGEARGGSLLCDSAKLPIQLWAILLLFCPWVRRR